MHFILLVDCVDEDEFDSKLSSLKTRWNRLELNGRRVALGETFEPEFFDWFVVEKRDIVCKCMLQNVRIAAQLGNPPERF